MQPENSVLVNRLIDTQENNNNNTTTTTNNNNNNNNHNHNNNNNNNMFWVHLSITHPMNPMKWQWKSQSDWRHWRWAWIINILTVRT